MIKNQLNEIFKDGRDYRNQNWQACFERLIKIYKKEFNEEAYLFDNSSLVISGNIKKFI